MALQGPGLLLEGARTNLVTSDDLTAWTAVASPVITPGIADPKGGISSHTVADTSGAARSYINRAVVFTGDGVKSLTFTIKERTAAPSGHILQLYDSTAAASRFLATVTWAAGRPVLSGVTGTQLAVKSLASGYWAVVVQTTSVTAANSHQLYIYPTTSTAASTGSLDVYRVNAFNAAAPLSLPVDASFAQAADNAYLDFTAAPQAMQVYHRCRDFGTYLTAGFARYWQIGDGTTGGLPRLTVYVSGTSIVALYETASGQRSSVVVPASFGYADLLELLVTLTAAGSVRLHVSVNEGAVQDGGASTTLTLPGAWAGQRLYIGGTGDGTRNGFAQHLALISRLGADKDTPYFRSLL